MQIYPCNKCTKRVIGCHATCEQYQDVKELNDSVLRVKHAAQAAAVQLNYKYMNALHRKDKSIKGE